MPSDYYDDERNPFTPSGDLEDESNMNEILMGDYPDEELEFDEFEDDDGGEVDDDLEDSEKEEFRDKPVLDDLEEPPLEEIEEDFDEPIDADEE